MNSRIILIAAAILVLVGGGIYVMSKNNATQNMPASVTPTTTMTDTTQTTLDSRESTNSGDAAQGEVKEFVITGSNFKFDQKDLSVNLGDTVRITFKNTVGMHDFVIDAFNAKTKVIGAGQEETIEFVANKVGAFEYYCSVGTHRQLGMKGTLTVE